MHIYRVILYGNEGAYNIIDSMTPIIKITTLHDLNNLIQF